MHKGFQSILLLLMLTVNARAVTVAVLNRTAWPRSAGSEGIIKTLKAEKQYTLKVIDKISKKNLKDVDVVIISHAYDLANKDILRAFVKSGGGAMLTHDAAGSGRGAIGTSSFPEIAKTSHKGNGYLSPNPLIVPIKQHPITKGINPKGFKHTYWDHAILKPVDDRCVLMEDTAFKDGFMKHRFRGTQLRWNAYFGGNAVLIAAKFGKGRVVLCGLHLGQNRKHQTAVLKGDELRLLNNSIDWLAGKTPLDLPEKIIPTKNSKYSSHLTQNLPAYLPNAITVIDKGKSGNNIKITISDKDELAKISTKEFEIVVAVEKKSNQPTIQSLKVRDFYWHRTWDGLERNSLTAPILRLSKSLWPFQKPFPSIYHERGKPLPAIKGKEISVDDFVTLKVGRGTITVSADGTITLDGFCKEGRIATEAIDGYLKASKFIEETVSYDQPTITGDWIWLIKRGSFAIGGKFTIADKMGETGLSTGMERKVYLNSNKLIIVTDIDKLNQLTNKNINKKTNKKSAEKEKAFKVFTVRPRFVQLRRLLKMRGSDEFFPILPEPIELYKDEFPHNPKVVSWRITEADNFLISFDNASGFQKQIANNDFAKANKTFDPYNEDKYVWRRFFIKYTGGKFPVTTQAKLIGSDKSGKIVIVVPLKLAVYVSLPIGIFTYSAQWTCQKDKTPPSQWPKLMRDIALRKLDYIIHDVTTSDGGETADKIMLRANRYGFRLLAAMLQPSLTMLKKNKKIDIARLQNIYSNIIQQYGKNINIIGWYLSDELATGKPGEKVFKQSYANANLLYDICKQLDTKRLAINLISRSSTPHEVAAKYIKTDVFCWDPYGVGAESAYNEAELINRLWRAVKNKPAWITLRCCGPNFYDCLDLWLDIRRRSLAAYRGNVDGMNYFMYAHWMKNLERYSYYAVFPGSKGPIGTPRWQALGQIAKDITLLTTAEYLLRNYTGHDKSLLNERYKQAEKLAQDGNFYNMRQILYPIIDKIK